MPQYTRVLCLGDSETFGARSTHGRTYPQYLEEILNERAPWVPTICLNRGINGERSWEIVNRGVDYLISDDWIRYCVTMMGTNDSKPSSRTNQSDYLKQWDRLQRACVSTGTILVALAIHPIHPSGQPEYDSESMPTIDRYNSWLKTWALSQNIEYVDSYVEEFADDPNLLADGIHPTNHGNQVIARAVADSIIPDVYQPRPAAQVNRVTEAVNKTGGGGYMEMVYGGVSPDDRRAEA